MDMRREATLQLVGAIGQVGGADMVIRAARGGGDRPRRNRAELPGGAEWPSGPGFARAVSLGVTPRRRRTGSRPNERIENSID
jgi:hypothetical protein